VALGAALAARAEPGRLAVRTFDAADGLAPGVVFRIVPDSKGFLWFCTAEGLSRFDGAGFVSFGARDGLGAGWRTATRTGCRT
jgi:ligand-binding sensor domain-containing protein